MVLVFLLAAALAAFFGAVLGRYLPRWPLPILAVLAALVIPFGICVFLALILFGSDNLIFAIIYLLLDIGFVVPAAVLIGGLVAYYAAAWGKGRAQEAFE